MERALSISQTQLQCRRIGYNAPPVTEVHMVATIIVEPLVAEVIVESLVAEVIMEPLAV